MLRLASLLFLCVCFVCWRFFCGGGGGVGQSIGTLWLYLVVSKVLVTTSLHFAFEYLVCTPRFSFWVRGGAPSIATYCLYLVVSKPLLTTSLHFVFASLLRSSQRPLGQAWSPPLDRSLPTHYYLQHSTFTHSITPSSVCSFTYVHS